MIDSCGTVHYSNKELRLTSDVKSKVYEKLKAEYLLLRSNCGRTRSRTELDKCCTQSQV